MAPKFLSLLTIPSFLILPLFLSLSMALSTTPMPRRTICMSTQDPSYCESVLPNQTANVYAFGRFSLRQSLSHSRQFLDSIEKHLRNRSSLSIEAIRVLEDCHQLADFNVDFLLNSFQTINANSDQTLPTTEADRVQALLSAVLTNLETCLDGLQSTSSAHSLMNDLSVPLSNDTKLHGVSLALFSKGWVPEKNNGMTWQPTNRRLLFSNAKSPSEMSDRIIPIYEQVSRKRILQTSKEVFVREMVTVSQDGSGNFTTINAAISVAPNNTKPNKGYFMIYVKAGVYEEYISIPKNKNYLFMMGDGINQTVITGNRSVVDGWTTFNSATFVVVAPNFIAVNITFRNTAGTIKHQAVALRSGADLSVFYKCSFEGYQDTLYTHSLRQFYRECDIYGTVDFIFGNAAVVLQNCNIYPKLPMNGQFNAITAQGRTDPNQNTGTSIHNCVVRAADDLASSNRTVKTYLGRPWKEYSRTVYMQSFMDSLIEPAGWSIWSGDFALSTLYYAEYGNTGPGSNTSNRVTWPGYHVINATDASNFTVSSFITGNSWLPETGVPYVAGLL